MKNILACLMLCAIGTQAQSQDDLTRKPAFKSDTSGFTAAEKARIRKYESAKERSIVKELAKSSSIPFDENVDSLPADYRGHNCRAIAKKINSSNVQKGEFETSQEYGIRVDRLKNMPLYGSIKVHDLLSFVGNEEVHFGKYDPDKGVAEISIMLIDDQRIWDDGHPSKAVVISSEVEARKSYPAANSFGSAVSVTQSIYNVCAVAFDKITTATPGAWRSLRTEFPISPVDAKSAKGNIGALFIGTLAIPFQSEYSGYIKPTLGNPVEIVYNGDNLAFSLQQVWIFNKKTGSILVKIDKRS